MSNSNPGMNNPRSYDRPGIFAHLAGLFASFTAYLRARLELAGIEAKEAAVHYAIIVALLIGALIVFVFGYLFLCFGLVFSIAALIDTKHAWIWVTFGMALLHLGAAAACVFLAKSRFSKPMFAVTLDELRKDQEWLTNESRN
jgi:uncharacterized membrane protein YqjE